MSTYKIRITETLSRCVDVEAPDVDTAFNMVEEMYNSCEVVLDSEDFTGNVEYSLVEKV
jgi:hypothetical protein